MTTINLHFSHTGNRRAATRVLIGALACFGIAATTVASAAMYKWVDEDGVLHYSSAVPEKFKAEVKRLDAKALDVSRARTLPNARKPVATPVAADLTGKVEALERQVEEEHKARLAADEQNRITQAAYAQALADQQAVRTVAYQPTIPVLTSGMVLSATHHRNFADECARDASGQCAHREHAEHHHELQQGSVGVIRRQQ